MSMKICDAERSVESSVVENSVARREDIISEHLNAQCGKNIKTGETMYNPPLSALPVCKKSYIFIFPYSIQRTNRLRYV